MIVGQNLPFQQKTPFDVKPFNNPLNSQRGDESENRPKAPEEGLIMLIIQVVVIGE